MGELVDLRQLLQMDGAVLQGILTHMASLWQKISDLSSMMAKEQEDMQVVVRRVGKKSFELGMYL